MYKEEMMVNLCKELKSSEQSKLYLDVMSPGQLYNSWEA